MSHPQKLQKAINGLLFNHPFFAAMLLRQRIEANEETETFSVDGETLRYAPSFLEKLTHDETVGVLAHEMLHLASFHHARMTNRDCEKWNKACDYAINPILKASGFQLPKGALLNPSFAGKSAEEIYRALPDEPKDGDKSGKDGQGGQSKPPSKGAEWGKVAKPPGKTPAEAEEQAAVQVKQATNQAKAMGKLPAHLERAVTSVPASVDWREALARFVSEQAKTDYSWSRPSRRMLWAGLILPSLHSLTIGNVVFIADTSASITEAEVKKLCAEMLNALQTFEELGKVAELLAIYCDSEVKRTETLTPFDTPRPIGGGGTDFKPPFDWLERNGVEPIAAVYLTDGCCSSFPEPPAFPVLWVRIGNYEGFNPPFGEVIKTDLH